MAKGPRTVLTLPDGIAGHWDLPHSQPEALGGGYHNDVFRVGEVVVRIEERELASAAWEHELLAWLAPEVPEIALPLPGRDGSTLLALGDRVASVLPYVEGEPQAGLPAADLLARVHRRGAAWPALRERPGRPSYSDLDWEQNDWWEWSIVPKPPELVRAFEHTRAWIASEPSLARTPIHGDPAQQNFLWRRGRIAGVIDWEWARVDWPAVELAFAAWAFSPEDPAMFVSAYAGAGGPGEPEAMEEGRRIDLVANTLYSFTRGNVDGPWEIYLLAELRKLP